MYPRLLELPWTLPKIGTLTIYTYGVLLAAAYLLGLKLAMGRAKARGLDHNRVLDLGIYAASLAHHQLVARIGLALIIGGAAGNLIDRVLTGSVVDFVYVYWRSYHFWVFNVADSAISIGVAIMILDMLGAGEHVSKTV